MKFTETHWVSQLNLLNLSKLYLKEMIFYVFCMNLQICQLPDSLNVQWSSKCNSHLFFCCVGSTDLSRDESVLSVACDLHLQKKTSYHLFLYPIRSWSIMLIRVSLNSLRILLILNEVKPIGQGEELIIEKMKASQTQNKLDWIIFNIKIEKSNLFLELRKQIMNLVVCGNVRQNWNHFCSGNSNK